MLATALLLVFAVLQVLQDQRINDKLDKLAEDRSKIDEDRSKIDELLCLVQERMIGVSDEPKVNSVPSDYVTIHIVWGGIQYKLLYSE